MQYESIILELMSRIKKLEDDVKLLKDAQSCLLPVSAPADDHPQDETLFRIHNDSTVSYKKMTDEMIDICYRCGKKVHDGESAQDLADEIAAETGMNRNSAIMYLYAVNGMLDGTIYKRAISSKALQTYFDRIFNEYGHKGLQKAIQATKLHINYRRECGHTVDSIEEICSKYENRL